MARTTKILALRLIFLLTSLLITGMVQAQPSIPVGLYIDCNQPEQLQMSFRNRGAEFSIPEGLLPWNSITFMRIKAFTLKEGKATPLELYAPISDHMRKVKVSNNEVISGALNLGDVIKDFEATASRDDIIVTYSLATPPIAQIPSFKTPPTVVIVPKQIPPPKACPQTIPIN